MLDAARVTPESAAMADLAGPVDPAETSPYAWFSLGDSTGTDSTGAAIDSTPGYTVGYGATSTLTATGGGNLVPDSSNQGSIDIDNQRSGTVATWDGAGGDVLGSTHQGIHDTS